MGHRGQRHSAGGRHPGAVDAVVGLGTTRHGRRTGRMGGLALGRPRLVLPQGGLPGPRGAHLARGAQRPPTQPPVPPHATAPRITPGEGDRSNVVTELTVQALRTARAGAPPTAPDHRSHRRGAHGGQRPRHAGEGGDGPGAGALAGLGRAPGRPVGPAWPRGHDGVGQGQGGLAHRGGEPVRRVGTGPAPGRRTRARCPRRGLPRAECAHLQRG